MQAPNVMVGCHYLVGTSGTLKKEELRAVELAYAIDMRAKVLGLGLGLWLWLWPASLPRWVEEA